MNQATLAPALLALGLALVASVVGGAISGLLIGAKALGRELAALMGVFFGPMAGFIGVGAGLLVSLLLS